LFPTAERSLGKNVKFVIGFTNAHRSQIYTDKWIDLLVSNSQKPKGLYLSLNDKDSREFVVSFVS